MLNCMGKDNYGAISDRDPILPPDHESDIADETELGVVTNPNANGADLPAEEGGKQLEEWELNRVYETIGKELYE